jgi:hypothetical protein
MITAVTLNSIMQFAFMICLMFYIGDLDQVENSPTGLPIIEVYYQATKSYHATNVLVVMMALILFISLFNIFASVSRLTWSFATDKGLPFSKFFSYVRISSQHCIDCENLAESYNRSIQNWRFHSTHSTWSELSVPCWPSLILVLRPRSML